MCFVFIWEQTATCATYSINWLVFITEIKSVYSAVRTGALYINQINISFPIFIILLHKAKIFLSIFLCTALQSLVTPESVCTYYTIGLYKPPSFHEEIKYIFIITILSRYVTVCVCVCVYCIVLTLGYCYWSQSILLQIVAWLVKWKRVERKSCGLINVMFTYIPYILIISMYIYLPTDAQLNCLKNF